MTSHHAATIDRVLAAYAAIWSEPDAARREALLKSCWSEDSEIAGPGYAFKGTQAVLAEAARFQAQEPGARVVLTRGFDAHGRWARFTFALLSPDGGVANEGWDLVELAADGRIARVISFWGPLPPVATDLLPGRILGRTILSTALGVLLAMPLHTPYFATPEAPFSWEPDQVEVLESGTLALSTGPVRDPAGVVIARFNSIWRLEAANRWRVVFDKGSPPSPGPK